MIPRSFLFVPADSESKLAKAKSSAADAVVLDLEEAAADRRAAARGLAREYLQAEAKGSASLWVRINPVGGEDFEDDLEAVVASGPAGLLVPGADTPDTLRLLDRYISALEDRFGLPSRGIQLMPLATDSPMAVASLMEYRNPPPRLAGLAWSATALAAALGAAPERSALGGLTDTFRMVRAMALVAAKAAGVAAIDASYADIRDYAGLSRRAEAARKDGFSGMLAVHPDQVALINAAFAPSSSDVDHARRVAAAFGVSNGAAVLDGRTLDGRDLARARQVLVLDEKIRSRTKA